MPSITIDNQTIEVPDGATILDGAKLLGISIPTLCHLEGVASPASCFVCVVKVQGRENLVPSCATRVVDGMIIQSQTPEVLTARRTCLELLMSDHVGDCIAPCQSVCPARLDIPLMLRHVQAGKLSEAAALARDSLVLPAVLGRICPAPCQRACRRTAHDGPIAIKSAHCFLADVDAAKADRHVPTCQPSSGKTVAVVGAGPAGLSAAFSLLRLGHACIIFDAHDLPGGMLRYGVDLKAMPRDVLDSEIAVIRQLGVEFRLEHSVDARSLADIRKRFDAVIIAAGAATSEIMPWLVPAGQEPPAGVFAATCPPAQRMTVRAVAQGKAAADAADRFLRSGMPAAPPEFSCHIGQLLEGEMEKFLAAIRAEPSASSRPAAGPPAADCRHCEMTHAQLLQQAARCLHCDCRKADDCRLRDHCAALAASSGKYKSGRRLFEQDLSHPQIIYESGKCIACGLCIAVAASRGVPGLTFIGRGFDVRVRTPFDMPLAKALGSAALECVKACPTGALALR